MADAKGEHGAAQRVSAAEYARHRGCSRAAVAKAIAQNRITSVRRNERGHWSIDVEACDREWARNTGPRKEVELAGRTAEGVEAVPVEPEAQRTPADLLHARTLREEALADEARLKVEQIRGNLVPADQVRARWFSAMRSVRETLLPLAARLAAELAAETDPAKVEIRLEEEIAQALAGLSDAG